MTKSSERRDGPRIDLRLRVRYSSSSGAKGEAEASDVSPRGCRLESDNPVEAGSELEMILDGGDEEELTARGRVTWCRPRQSPAGRQLFDIGVAFDDDWLAQDRGPLGTALARIFAMNRFEPARDFERTKVALKASTSSSPPVSLEIVDISIGGMQLRATNTEKAPVSSKGTVIVEIDVSGETHSIDGRVVWIAGASFGVQFSDTGENDTTFLEGVQRGEVAPERVTVFLQS